MPGKLNPRAGTLAEVDSRAAPSREAACPPDRLSADRAEPQEIARGRVGSNDPVPMLAILWLAIQVIDSAPRRVRRATKHHEEAVLRAVRRFGFRVPILVRTKPDGRYEIVDGHTRLAVARRLDAEKVPCLVIDDLPEVEVRRLVLSCKNWSSR